MIRRPPTITRPYPLFPYTTLFRSGQHLRAGELPRARQPHDRRPAVRRRRATLRFRRSPEARAHHPHRWSAGVMSENEPQTDQTPADDTQALTGEPASAAPMRLRAEPPRVTRLSRKVLAGIGLDRKSTRLNSSH